jgi:hypothetical protein
MCTVRTRVPDSLVPEEAMAEMECARFQCTGIAEAGHEFCSDECRSAQTMDRTSPELSK